MKITRIETDLLRLPLPRAVSLPAAQDARAATTVDVVLVQLHTRGTEIGLGFTYALGGGGAAIRSIIDTMLAPVLIGQTPIQTESLFLRMQAELQGLGFAGIGARATAALDFALWDWKGKVAGMPVAQLLGGYRTKLKAIVADTATPALGTKQAIKDTIAALERGAAGVQIEIGTVDPELDEQRLRQLREGVPDGAWFEINASGRYDFSTAAYMGQLGEQDFGIDSFNDPLRPDDLDNLARLVDRLETGIAVGSLVDSPADFLRILDRGGISALRVDPVRMGGLTPARKIAHLAELKQVAIYPVRLPEIGAHLCGGVVYGRMCEYVDWFETLFLGGPQFQNDQLVVPNEPGLGLTLNETVASQHRV
jgi:L-alanine-DL-glutamate epimerase-like enolase superfamily enzyme